MRRTILFVFVIGLIVSACKTSGSDSAKNNAQDVQSNGFDLTKIPISTAQIGTIPYFQLPDGYTFSTRYTNDYDYLRFWTGSEFLLPEGKVFQSRITPVSGKSFSSLEFMKGFEATLKEAGAVQIFEGKVPREEIGKFEEINGTQNRINNLDAYGFQGYAKSWIYVVRQPNKYVWFQINESDDNASINLGIVESEMP